MYITKQYKLNIRIVFRNIVIKLHNKKLLNYSKIIYLPMILGFTRIRKFFDYIDISTNDMIEYEVKLTL